MYLIKFDMGMQIDKISLLIFFQLPMKAFPLFNISKLFLLNIFDKEKFYFDKYQLHISSDKV